MKIIQSLTVYITAFVLLIVILLGAALVAIILFKRKKRNLLNEEDSPEKKNYKNALDLVKIDDIADDMIITEGRKSFIAVLKCRGADFLRSDLDEQVRTEYAYVNFWLAQDTPITYRQYGEDINLEYTIGRYEKARRTLESDVFNAEEDRKALKSRFEKFALRKSIDFPLVNCAVAEDADGQIHIVLGACYPSPKRMTDAEECVKAGVTEESAQAAGDDKQVFKAYFTAAFDAFNRMLEFAQKSEDKQFFKEKISSLISTVANANDNM